jgi:hypothetical protein
VCGCRHGNGRLRSGLARSRGWAQDIWSSGNVGAQSRLVQGQRVGLIPECGILRPQPLVSFSLTFASPGWVWTMESVLLMAVTGTDRKLGLFE